MLLGTSSTWIPVSKDHTLTHALNICLADKLHDSILTCSLHVAFTQLRSAATTILNALSVQFGNQDERQRIAC